MTSKTKTEILEIKEKFEQAFNKVVTNPYLYPWQHALLYRQQQVLPFPFQVVIILNQYLQLNKQLLHAIKVMVWDLHML